MSLPDSALAEFNRHQTEMHLLTFLFVDSHYSPSLCVLIMAQNSFFYSLIPTQSLKKKEPIFMDSFSHKSVVLRKHLFLMHHFVHPAFYCLSDLVVRLHHLIASRTDADRCDQRHHSVSLFHFLSTTIKNLSFRSGQI